MGGFGLSPPQSSVSEMGDRRRCVGIVGRKAEEKVQKEPLPDFCRFLVQNVVFLRTWIYGSSLFL